MPSHRGKTDTRERPVRQGDMSFLQHRQTPKGIGREKEIVSINFSLLLTKYISWNPASAISAGLTRTLRPASCATKRYALSATMPTSAYARPARTEETRILAAGALKGSTEGSLIYLFRFTISILWNQPVCAIYAKRADTCQVAFCAENAYVRAVSIL